MATLFAQSIIQFAPLRTVARIHTNTPHAQLIRELFPKALFDEQNVSHKVFIEIAWSFLSSATTNNYHKKWQITSLRHRIGGLPTIIWIDGTTRWYKDGKSHRDDKDPQTGLTLPATIWVGGSRHWCKGDKLHRDDKDPQTGLTLPAEVYADGSQYWWKNGKLHRDDIDPNTGLTLPTVIDEDGMQSWYKDGKFYRDDIDSNTGLTLPAGIRANI